MPNLLLILPWIKNNWKLVAVLAVLAGTYFYGRYEGAKSAKTRWTAAIESERAVRQAEKDALQASMDRKAAEYEEARHANETALAVAQRRLKHEKAKNAAYSQCHAGAEFLRIYEGAGNGAGSAGEAGR